MQIRSITLGLDAAWPAPPGLARDAGGFLREARRAFEAEGFVVQTTRLCTQPGHRFISPESLAEFARSIESVCSAVGIEYCAVGGISLGGDWRESATVQAISEALCSTERAFCSLNLVSNDAIDYAAVRAAASVMRRVADATSQGFGNLRFAAIARCPPNTPFFPVAYHAGGPPRFSLALQAADLAVFAFSAPGALAEVEDRLVASLEHLGSRLEAVAEDLERRFEVAYYGIDLSLAPFPSHEASVANGLEALGLDRFGAPGTVLAAWRLTSALRRARVRRCGFSGLMLPVLEDSTLAQRASEGLVSVSELLLYACVCGTGLDTVPLPGDVIDDELTGILLEVAALALALNKPLTARLFPVPGLQAGDSTSFDFPFFANSRVLSVKGYGASRLLERAGAGGGQA